MSLACKMCPEEIIGRAVMIIPDHEEGDSVEGKPLHISCFEDMMEQMFKQEGTTIFQVVVASTEDIKSSVVEVS